MAPRPIDQQQVAREARDLFIEYFADAYRQGRDPLIGPVRGTAEQQQRALMAHEYLARRGLTERTNSRRVFRLSDQGKEMALAMAGLDEALGIRADPAPTTRGQFDPNAVRRHAKSIFEEHFRQCDRRLNVIPEEDDDRAALKELARKGLAVESRAGGSFLIGPRGVEVCMGEADLDQVLGLADPRGDTNTGAHVPPNKRPDLGMEIPFGYAGSMAKAHDDAKSTICLALVATLVASPLDPSLSRDELKQVLTASGVSSQVYSEVIQGEFARRDQERSPRLAISSLDLMLFQMADGFPVQLPIDAAYKLGKVFEQLNYDGVTVPKTLDALHAASDEPPDVVDRALGIMMVFGIAKAVPGGYVSDGMDGDYGKSVVGHPLEAKLARMVETIRGAIGTRASSSTGASAKLDRSARPGEAPGVTTGDKTKVFIIHGRNVAARNAVEQFVRCLGLVPLDFDQVSADLGGSPFVGEVVRKGLELAHGIVALFTPDEFAALDSIFRSSGDRGADSQRWQARPNVIFEAGMAFGMSRERTVLVTLGGEVSLFSDVAGIHTVRLDNHVDSRKKLRQRLIGMHCAVDQRTDAWTEPGRSGDFETCIKRLAAVTPRDPFGEATPPNVQAAKAAGSRGVAMSQEAEQFMRHLGKLYVEHGHPNHKAWTFDKGADTPLHSELHNGLGFIKLMGTMGAAYSLTDRGHAWIMAHKAEGEAQ